MQWKKRLKKLESLALTMGERATSFYGACRESEYEALQASGKAGAVLLCPDPVSAADWLAGCNSCADYQQALTDKWAEAHPTQAPPPIPAVPDPPIVRQEQPVKPSHVFGTVWRG